MRRRWADVKAWRDPIYGIGDFGIFRQLAELPTNVRRAIFCILKPVDIDVADTA